MFIHYYQIKSILRSRFYICFVIKIYTLIFCLYACTQLEAKSVVGEWSHADYKILCSFAFSSMLCMWPVFLQVYSPSNVARLNLSPLMVSILTNWSYSSVHCYQLSWYYESHVTKCDIMSSQFLCLLYIDIINIFSYRSIKHNYNTK